MSDNSCVKVAVRIRPQIPRDIIDLCHVCTSVASTEPQIWLGKDKAFTFDEVFDMPTTQEDIYDKCVKALVNGCFEGYNATVLAYGQTGSGKTYTMGTGFDLNIHHLEHGIIPRAVEHLFQEISYRQRTAKETGMSMPEFKVNAQFMELYNEEIIDLLDSSRENEEKGRRTNIKIHEDAGGSIYTVGVIAQCVTSVEEALQCLKLGSLSRTTASTGMNLQSSRSHAIFTLHIKQQRIVKIKPFADDVCNSDNHEHNSLEEFETLTAKFHFVDLAGSERLKRTKATGERQKEGISINSGLLALGNVISALGEKSRKITHVPYRDSKLTRLLQDSLGGNSRTLMIACISPSDRDFMETLNTLKYANRAKNIKNKVIVNMDKTSQTISMLRQDIENLKLELLEYKQGKRIVGEDGIECVNDMYHENTMLQTENSTLKTRVKALQETIDRLTIKNSELLAEKAAGNWMMADGTTSEIAPVIQEYIREIETLRSRLLEAEEMCSCLRKLCNKPSSRLSASPSSTVAITGQYDIHIESPTSVYELIEQAKEDVKLLKKKKKKMRITCSEKEYIEGGSDGEKDIDEKNEPSDVSLGGQEDSSSESDSVEENYSEDFAGLTTEISMKQRLINQLEMSQRRLLNMRQSYEEKIITLQKKIQETERERDRVLSEMKKFPESQLDDKARLVSANFEKKITALKNDMKNMQSAKKEHFRFVKAQGNYERQMMQLKKEMADLKRTKVALVNKMKEESKKHKESETVRNREIAQLRKDGRTKETQIRTLESEKRLKEAVLRRKQEEVMALRKRNKTTMVRKPSNSVKTSPYNRSNVFSPRLAKQKWQTLEKKITKLVLNKQSVSTIEKDMERWLEEREKLSRCLEKVMKKRDRALLEMKGSNIINDLEEDIENLKANIEYIHENITECQTSIVQLEETKDDMDAIDLANTLKNMHIEESKYLIEKLLNMAINQSFQAAQKESAIKELDSELKQVVESNAVQEQLLLHVLHQANESVVGRIELLNLAEENENAGSGDSSRSTSPIDSSIASEKNTFVILDNPRRKKAREIAATTEDLLFSKPPNDESETLRGSFESEDPLLNSPTRPNEAVISGKLEERGDASSFPCGLTSAYHEYNTDFSVLSQRTPTMDSLEEQQGQVIPFHQKSDRQQTSSYLLCTHVVEGHTQGVVGLECTDDVLFSSSKDRTVKIWDLTSGKEVQQLTGHPNTVVKVRYCEYTRLAFTVSMSYIKVWDVRVRPSNCIYTLSSSGVSRKGSMASETVSRHVIPPGENQINDIALNHYGTTLFSASSGSIRMWDLRMCQSIGALNAGFQSLIMCLVVDDMGLDKNLVISGSKDHSIKVFEVMDNSRGVHPPKFTLSPPHYDGVQSLALNGDFLFSGSRDMCIKKWNLGKRCLEKSVREAHHDWICALDVVPSGNLLLSGCRSGYLSLWSTDSIDCLEELRGHGSAINAITSNKTRMFTASNDSTIGIWSLGNSSRTHSYEFAEDST